MLVHDHWLLTAQRAAIHRPTGTAVVADLHLGYDQARRAAGEAVPDSGLGETVTALDALVGLHGVRRLVVAGDLVESRAGLDAAGELADWLRRRGVELVGVVPGNHDRDLEQLADRLPLRPDGVSLGGWRVVHGDGALPAERLVLGHFHPCFRWRGRVDAACYLAGPRRLVLPAFSAEAAGTSVLGVPAWRDLHCGVIVGAEVLDFGPVADLSQRLGR
jgi:putative SbcD/Mre11-related phosphoesterase